MKRTIPSMLTVISGGILIAVAVALLIWRPLSGERETPPTRPATAQEGSSKSARANRPATEPRRNRTEEPPLSPDARALLAELTETIEQGESGRILAEKCRKAGVRASDFLDLASMIKARTSELGTFNLEVVLGWAAQLDGQAAAEWYDRNVSREFLEQHKWIGWTTLFLSVAIDWMRFEPREAIRWADGHKHLSVGSTPDSNLTQILGYWPKNEFAGQIEWLEEQARAGRPRLVYCLEPSIRNWAKVDPVAAVNWMESFAENETSSWAVRDKGYRELALGWQKDRLPEAVEWLARRGQGDTAYDAARRIVAERLTKSDPMAAIGVAIDITNKARGDSLIIMAARELYKSDPETVIDWLPESGLSEEVHRAILSPDS